jgi:hypothetical protein
MPKLGSGGILLDFQRAGGTVYNGIVCLPELIKRSINRSVSNWHLVLYNRVSSYGQAGKGKPKLQEKTAAVVAKIHKLAPGRLLETFDGVEEGKLSKRRTHLRRAVEYAKERRAILVAGDVSRFIRSEQFCHVNNVEARPTLEEFARFRAMTGSLILATVAHPMMTESQRRSLATKATDKCGRPREYVDQKARIEDLRAG